MDKNMNKKEFVKRFLEEDRPKKPKQRHRFNAEFPQDGLTVRISKSLMRTGVYHKINTLEKRSRTTFVKIVAFLLMTLFPCVCWYNEYFFGIDKIINAETKNGIDKIINVETKESKESSLHIGHLSHDDSSPILKDTALVICIPLIANCIVLFLFLVYIRKHGYICPRCQNGKFRKEER